MADVTLKVKIPLKLANELEQILQTKGLTLDEAARIYFRSCVSKSIRRRALGLGDTFPFGKYQDEYVEVVAKAEPDYILWLIDNNIKVNFQPEVLDLVEKILAKETHPSHTSKVIDWKRHLIDNHGHAVQIKMSPWEQGSRWQNYYDVINPVTSVVRTVHMVTGKTPDGYYWVEND